MPSQGREQRRIAFGTPAEHRFCCADEGKDKRESGKDRDDGNWQRDKKLDQQGSEQGQQQVEPRIREADSPAPPMIRMGLARAGQAAGYKGEEAGGIACPARFARRPVRGVSGAPGLRVLRARPALLPDR